MSSASLDVPAAMRKAKSMTLLELFRSEPILNHRTVDPVSTGASSSSQEDTDSSDSSDERGTSFCFANDFVCVHFDIEVSSIFFPLHFVRRHIIRMIVTTPF
jgi:hypothetical protein